MYATLKDYLNDYNPDIVNLILINYHKLSRVSFKSKLILYQTKVYNHLFEDLGLPNIRKIKTINDSYFAITYNNNLYAWGDNTFGQLILPDHYIERPTLIMKLVKRISLGNEWLSIIDVNNKMTIYGNFNHEYITDNVKKFSELKPLTWDDQLFTICVFCYNNVKYHNKGTIIMNDNSCIRAGRKFENVKKVYLCKDIFYVLTNVIRHEF